MLSPLATEEAEEGGREVVCACVRCRWLWLLPGADDEDDDDEDDGYVGLEAAAAASSGWSAAVDRARGAEADVGLNCTTAPNLAALAATDAPCVLIAAAAVAEWGPCCWCWCWFCCPRAEGVSVSVPAGVVQGNHE